MIPVQVIGLGMGPADLTARARESIAGAQVLVGGRRHLGYFLEHTAEKLVLGKDVREVLSRVKELAETQRVVILASGDPNFFGIGPLAVEVLGAGGVEVQPNITAAQAASARLGLAWQEARIVSLHGRGWENLTAVLGRAAQIIIYTDGQHTPARMAAFLMERGFEGVRLAVLEDLGQPGELITWLTPATAAGKEFSPLNVVALMDDEAKRAPRLSLGLTEAEVAHEAGLITKDEVRAVALAKLRLGPGQVVWDIGAGSGAVSLEASGLTAGGTVYAIEQHEERIAQITANRRRWRAANVEIVAGQAPECLAELPDPERVFVGGGGAALKDILAVVSTRCGPGGRVVVSAALLESMATAREALAAGGWETEVVQLQVSRGRALGAGTYLQALNPVWLITGWRQNARA